MGNRIYTFILLFKKEEASGDFKLNEQRKINNQNKKETVIKTTDATIV